MTRVPKVNQWDVVRVHWTDSSSFENGWQDVKPRDLIITGCITVGMAYAVKDDCMTIVHSRDTVNGLFNGGITIPLVNVEKVEVLARHQG